MKDKEGGRDGQKVERASEPHCRSDTCEGQKEAWV